MIQVKLTDGSEHDVIGVDDAEAWIEKFAGRGTSQLNDWIEVSPIEGRTRTFVRASDIVTVALTEDT
jgi:hypothetical protein